MRRRSTCSRPEAACRPARALRIAISGSPSCTTPRSSMRIVSACNASGGSTCGSTSGQVGSSKGSSLCGRSRLAPVTSSASSRRVRPSNGRSAGSRVTTSASNTMRPIAQLARGVGTQSGSRWRGIEKCTPRRVIGPEAGPSADFQVSDVPAGRRATICRSSTSRPPMVVSSQYSSAATPTAIASVPMPLRSATLRRRLPRSVRSSAMRASRCSLLASAGSGSSP